jgi:DNA-binding NtrC family response regulator
LRVSNESGLEVIETVKTVAPDTEVIMITGYGSIDTAVEAIKSGAADYLTKPFEDAELLMVVQKALNQKKMKSELKHLRKAFAENYSFDNIIGSSPAVRKIIDVIKQVAPQDINVLIWGESGTGKELFAKAIHNNSSRRDAKFVAINCSAMPDLLLESELFGHVSSRKPTAEPYSSMKSATLHRLCKPSYCEFCRRKKSAPSAPTRPAKPTCE